MFDQDETHSFLWKFTASKKSTQRKKERIIRKSFGAIKTCRSKR